MKNEKLNRIRLVGVEQFCARALLWVTKHCRILVDALDEGERIHQLVQYRKNEEIVKALRNGITL